MNQKTYKYKAQLYRVAIMRIMQSQLILTISMTIAILIGYAFKIESLFYILHFSIIITAIITTLIYNRMNKKQKIDELEEQKEIKEEDNIWDSGKNSKT